MGDIYYWRRGLKPLPWWKSKTAQHAAKRKANAGLKINQTKAKKSKDDLHPDLHPEEEPVLDLCSEVPENEECVRRVILLSEGERSRLLAEGSGLTLATVELDSTMGVGSQTDLSIEVSDVEEESSRVVRFTNKDRSKLPSDGSGSTPASLELDSTTGVGSRLDLSREDSDEKAYRLLKELVDEPEPSRSRMEPKKGVSSGTKKKSRSRIRDSRVYSYDELIEYRPRMEDSDDDSFWFKVNDTDMEF